MSLRSRKRFNRSPSDGGTRLVAGPYTCRVLFRSALLYALLACLGAPSGAALVRLLLPIGHCSPRRRGDLNGIVLKRRRHDVRTLRPVGGDATSKTDPLSTDDADVSGRPDVGDDTSKIGSLSQDGTSVSLKPAGGNDLPNTEAFPPDYVDVSLRPVDDDDTSKTNLLSKDDADVSGRPGGGDDTSKTGFLSEDDTGVSQSPVGGNDALNSEALSPDYADVSLRPIDDDDTSTTKPVSRPNADISSFPTGGDEPSKTEAVSREENGAGASVRYLAPLDFSQGEDLQPADGALVMPCFPLGPMGYVPDTEEVLKIFERRYRQMYNDILFSGGRRFVVPQVAQTASGGTKLSEVGVVFYLQELKDVTERTEDRVKYVCQHSIIGRVKLKRVLNPRALADESTYLRVEYEEFKDEDEDADNEFQERAVMVTLAEVADLQESFQKDLVAGMNSTRGPGFWNIVKFWQSYLMHRAKLSQSEFERSIRVRIERYYGEIGKPMPQEVSLGEMPPDIQRDVVALQRQFQEEVEPLMMAQSTSVQEFVQTEGHGKRLRQLLATLNEEKRRLEARRALKLIFSDASG